MTLLEFKRNPWKKKHPIYDDSALSISPAPEYASSEVLLASLYRTIGLESISEGNVPQAGRELERKLQKLRDNRRGPPSDSTLGVDAWSMVLHGVLESPKLPKQSAQRFLQVTPLVPSMSHFSGSARLSSNPWSPGSLIRRMVWLGSKDQEAAQDLWGKLFDALSIKDDDDVFARWLERETTAWGVASRWQLAKVDPKDVANLALEDFGAIEFMPARRFASDLYAIIQAKQAMTRRQWTSLLESVIRLASVAHVIWLSDVQTRIWACLSSALEGSGPADTEAVRAAIFPADPQYMTYGGKALNSFKDKASGYLAARLGTNAVLWALADAGVPYTGNISSSEDIASLCQHVRHNRQLINDVGVQQVLVDIREQEARQLNCKNGIGSNILEFSRHVLGQRQTAIQLLRGYDQGYILKKKGSHSSSPWVVCLGPVSVLALVHCALAGMGGPRSIHRLSQHLAAYGIAVDHQDIAQNDLGQQLRMLGLVLDSPDAESGMLLLPPFSTSLPEDKEE